MGEIISIGIKFQRDYHQLARHCENMKGLTYSYPHLMATCRKLYHLAWNSTFVNYLIIIGLLVGILGCAFAYVHLKNKFKEYHCSDQPAIAAGCIAVDAGLMIAGLSFYLGGVHSI